MKPKGRPLKPRKIGKTPTIVQFSPRGKPGRPDEVHLTIDQFETIRLADYDGFKQNEGAQTMGISRASFGRILRDARKTISDALINGKIIRIYGGNIKILS